ncbi:MAG TPA: hypothetical protein VK524_27085 [Polyangiaceae bacterium]|nr:hypothetical protein [Polyangiaceae bacterium]
MRTPESDRLLREASTRLKAELTSAGFEVLDVEHDPSDTSDTNRSFATIAINRAGQGALADVWISDHVTGKTLTRRLRVGATQNAATVLAVRALELLRASLLELTLPSTSPEAPPAAPADVLKWVEPRAQASARRGLLEGMALEAGILALHSVDGIGPALGPEARVSTGLGRNWFARLSLAAPLIGPTLNETGGTATVTQQFGSLDLGWATETRPFGAFAWLGAGAFYLHTTGTARAPYRATSDGVLSFLATAGVAGVARIGTRLALTGQLAAIGLVPKPVVVIAGQDAGSSGSPSLALSLGLLIGL